MTPSVIAQRWESLVLLALMMPLICSSVVIFTRPLKSQLTSCEGERFQLRATFCCEVLSGKIGVSVEMYRCEERACLFHYAPISCLPIIHQFLNDRTLRAHIQLCDAMNRRCCEQKRKSDNFHIWENKPNKCLTVC